jgi:hypothetical protein
VSVTDEVAHRLVEEYTAAELVSDIAPEPAQKVPATEQPATLATDDAPDTEDADAASDLDESGEPKRPYGNASKADWIHYALKVDPDLTAQAASDMSKFQLLQAYGERL